MSGDIDDAFEWLSKAQEAVRVPGIVIHNVLVASACGPEPFLERRRDRADIKFRSMVVNACTVSVDIDDD